VTPNWIVIDGLPQLTQTGYYLLESRMRSIVSLITAFSVVLHLWLGCCAHHTHDAGGELQRQASVIAPHVHHGHGHHHEHEPSSSAPASSSQPADSHNDCHETHCSFLSSVAAAPIGNVSLAFAAVATVTERDCSANLVVLRTWLETGSDAHLPRQIPLWHLHFLS